VMHLGIGDDDVNTALAVIKVVLEEGADEARGRGARRSHPSG
jgi:hypothetical protein